MLAVSGPIESPSPITSSVTPCRSPPCERPSSISESVDHDSMFTKPGATASPFASSVVVAAGRASPSCRTATIRSPRIATAPSNGSPPPPS
jgi:hypothetical protein